MGDFVPTRGSQIKKNGTKGYICVDYEAPKKKFKSEDDSNNKKSHNNNSMTNDKSAELKEQQEKEMKKLRYEIIKFGMSGFDKSKAKKAKAQLAINLGAIPPKNRRMNYKALKTRRKKEEERKIEEKHTSGFTDSLRKLKFRKKSKKDSGILGVYGKVSKDTMPKQKR